MRTLTLFVFIILCLSTTGQQSLQLNGNIRNVKSGTLVFLMNGSDGKTIATDTVKNGLFQLRATITEPDIFQLGFIGYKEALDLFLENGVVGVEGDFVNLSSARVNGSSVEQHYEQFKGVFNPMRDSLNGLVNLINPEKDRLKRDSLIRLFELKKELVVRTASSFIDQHKSSPVSPFVLYVMSPLLNGLPDVESRYQALDASAKRGSFARILEKGIADAKIGAVGTQAINFSQKDTLGKVVSLQSFKGKYVLVDFWASWCGPCRQENPNLVAAFNRFKSKNFTILGVSLDDNKPNWLAAIRKDKLTWTHVSDLKYFDNEVARLYRIQSIPASYLIDPTGKIIARNLRGEELMQTLTQLLK